MELLSETGHGLFSTLKDNWLITLATFGEEFQKVAKEGIQFLINKLQTLQKDGTITKWAQETKKALDLVIETVKQLTDPDVEVRKATFAALGILVKDAFVLGAKAAGDYLAKVLPPLGKALGEAIKEGMKRQVRRHSVEADAERELEEDPTSGFRKRPIGIAGLRTEEQKRLEAQRKAENQRLIQERVKERHREENQAATERLQADIAYAAEGPKTFSEATKRYKKSLEEAGRRDAPVVGDYGEDPITRAAVRNLAAGTGVGVGAGGEKKTTFGAGEKGWVSMGGREVPFEAALRDFGIGGMGSTSPLPSTLQYGTGTVPGLGLGFPPMDPGGILQQNAPLTEIQTDAAAVAPSEDDTQMDDVVRLLEQQNELLDSRLGGVA
jgi:hypothetical protein